MHAQFNHFKCSRFTDSVNALTFNPDDVSVLPCDVWEVWVGGPAGNILPVLVWLGYEPHSTCWIIMQAYNHD